MSRETQKTGARQAAKRPPDRALLRYAPPSPKRGLGPPGNDPSRRPGTDIAQTDQQPELPSRLPIDHHQRWTRSGSTIIGDNHITTTITEHRRGTHIAFDRKIPSNPLVSSILTAYRRTGTTLGPLPQTTTRPVQTHSAGHEAEPTSSPQPAPNRHPSPDQRAPTGLYRWGRSPACRSPATSTCGYFPLPCGHSSRGKIAAGSGPSLRCGRSAVQDSGRPVLLRPIEADRRPVTTGE